jgi:transcriptional regulator with XRE-family HTH domain
MKAPTRTPGPAAGPAADPLGATSADDAAETASTRGDARFTSHLRQVTAQRVAATSLRKVAREIGMSATGLSKFLDGNAPYLPTLNRLRNWYLRYAATPAGTLSEEDAYAALALLVHDLAPDARQGAIEAMLACMREGYQRSGQPEPAWVAELPARFPPPPPPRRNRWSPPEEDEDELLA